MSIKMKRAAYADMFAPATGDRVRLADTDLVVEVERDFTVYGEEAICAGARASARSRGSIVRKVD